MNRRPGMDVPQKLGCGWLLWFAFCALLGLAFAGFIAWAIYTLVEHFAH